MVKVVVRETTTEGREKTMVVAVARVVVTAAVVVVSSYVQNAPKNIFVHTRSTCM